jgi:hypothetical protein
MFLSCFSTFQEPGNSGEIPERFCHCNPKTVLKNARGLSIQVTVLEREWEGRQYRESQETYLRVQHSTLRMQ